MALTLTYYDEYLRQNITESRETRGIALVADEGTLPAAWVTRLNVLQVYIITCLECMKSTEDLFSAKLGAYRKEYAADLAKARLAQAAIDAAAGTATGPASFFTVELFRS